MDDARLLRQISFLDPSYDNFFGQSSAIDNNRWRAVGLSVCSADPPAPHPFGCVGFPSGHRLALRLLGLDRSSLSLLSLWQKWKLII